MIFGQSFDRKAALAMAAEHNSFTPEQLGAWVDMHHKAGKLTDDEVSELSGKIPMAKVITDRIQAEKAAAAVIIGEVKEKPALCKTCGKEFIKATWNQVNCPACIAAAKK